MSVQPFQPLSGLARRLVNDGVFSSDVAMDALKSARKDNKPFIAHIIENRLVSAYRAAAAAADEFGMPLFDLDVLDVEALPQGLVDEKLITKHHALPLIKRENRLYVAISDPTNIQALDEFKFHTGTTTEGVIVEEDKLSHLIDTFLDEQNSALEGLEDADLDNLEIDDGVERVEDLVGVEL